MKRVAVTALIVASCVGTVLLARDRTARRVPAVSDLVAVLASDSFQGRKPGTAAMEKATAYAERCMRTIGLKPLWNNTFRDSFSMNGIMACNLIGLKESASPSDEYIIISAHLDHIGTVPGSTDSVFNGANDNATGVAAVLMIASQLRDKLLQKNVLFILFSGEESGLLGSYHLAEKMKQEGLKVSYMVNIEMIGVPLTSNKEKVYITGYDVSDFADVCNRLMEEPFITKLEAGERMGLFKASDNYPFYEKMKIPAHTISTFDFENYAYYHHLDDEHTALDKEHLESIIDKTGICIRKLLESNARVSVN